MSTWTKNNTYKGWCSVKLISFSQKLEGCSYRIIGGTFLQLLNTLQRKGFRPLPETHYDWQYSNKYFPKWTKEGYDWKYKKHMFKIGFSNGPKFPANSTLVCNKTNYFQRCL